MLRTCRVALAVSSPRTPVMALDVGSIPEVEVAEIDVAADA